MAKNDTIRIKGSTLRWGIAIALFLAVVWITLGYIEETVVPGILFGYARGMNVEYEQERYIGHRVRIRGYIKGEGLLITACHPPIETKTGYSLEGIDLMSCTIDSTPCSMTCPLFDPRSSEAYEVVGLVKICPDGYGLCLTDITEIHALATYTIGLESATTVPVTPGPVTFDPSQPW